MDQHISTNQQISKEGNAARPTRRAFLQRSALTGAVALGALLSAAGCGPKPAATGPAATGPAAAPTALPRPSPTIAQPRPTAMPDPTAAASGNPRQPNVLLITVDTLRADRTGPYGYAQAHTPTLNQLAREGVRFDHAICQLPQTDPSHAALMSGLYASTSGVKVHMVDKLRPGTETIASTFLAAGYQTAGIYSWVSLDPQFCGLNQGFQTYEDEVINRSDSAIFSNPNLEQLAATYRQIKASVPIIKSADAALGASTDIAETLDGRADVTNQAVFKWLNEHATAGPFLLWVHYFDPHYPYDPPKGYDHILGLDYHGSINGSIDTIHAIEQHKLIPSPADLARLEELYQGEIAFADAQIGKLFDLLDKLGVKDDTIITLTGDHGESFGEHGDWTHGLAVYETEIRVPLFMRYPRRLPAGAVVTAPAQLIDVMPTLFDLAGLKATQSIQGKSLLPIMTGQDSGESRAAFTELANEAFVSVLTFGNWKLIRNDANGQLQLYQLGSDEDEEHNLVNDDPQTTKDLSARLQDLMKISGVSK